MIHEGRIHGPEPLGRDQEAEDVGGLASNLDFVPQLEPARRLGHAGAMARIGPLRRALRPSATQLPAKLARNAATMMG